MGQERLEGLKGQKAKRLGSPSRYASRVEVAKEQHILFGWRNEQRACQEVVSKQSFVSTPSKGSKYPSGKTSDLFRSYPGVVGLPNKQVKVGFLFWGDGQRFTAPRWEALKQPRNRT